MEKDRGRRYASASDFAQDVDRYLRSQPVLAGPPSALYRIRKLAVRNRIVLATVIATLVLVFALGKLILITQDSQFLDGSAGAIPPHSVAVLPFQYTGPNPDNVYLGSGLSDELRDQLGRADGLGVAARSSSLFAVQKGDDVRTIAAMLGVAAILEGNMRERGNVLTISVALIDGKSGLAIWNETFERDAKALLDVQREIAEAVISEILPGSDEIVTEAATQNATANELMILARHYEQQALEVDDLDPDLLQRAVALYRDATKADPDSALALSRLAVAQMFIGDIDAGGVSASKALDLDPSLAEAHYAYGKFLFATANPRVGDEYERAVRLNANLPDALADYAFWYWFNVGPDGVAALFERALKLDRLNVVRYAALGRFLAMNERPDDARRVVAEMISLFDGAAAFRAIADVMNILGDVDHAIAWTIRARDAEPDNLLHEHKLAEYYTDIGAFKTAEMLEPDLGVGLLFKMRRYDEMIEKGIELYWENPGDVQLQVYLAVALNALGRYADALRLLEGSGVLETFAVVRRNTIEFDAHVALLNAVYGSGELDMAKDLVRLRENSHYSGDTNDWWVALNLGCSFAVAGQDEEVYRRFARAREGRHLAWEPMLKDSVCFERFADDPKYMQVVKHFDDLRAMLRQRLPDTLAEYGVVL